MSEISMYEAQKKKMQGLCDEHDLTYRFKKTVYPPVFTIKPAAGMDAQLSMLENVEETGYRSPDSAMTWIFADGKLQTKVTGGTFSISKELRTKIENILQKMITYWMQYFFRDVISRGALQRGMMPVIDESDAEDADEEEEDDTEDDPDERDEMYPELDGDTPLDVTEGEVAQATAIVRLENKASVSLLQRRMAVGFSKAANLMAALERRGIIGPYNGSGPREVLPADIPEDLPEEVTPDGTPAAE